MPRKYSRISRLRDPSPMLMDELINLDLGIEVGKLPSVKMPKFPSVSVPDFPKPPISTTTMDSYFANLKKNIDALTTKEYTYTYDKKTITGKGIGNFFVIGSTKLNEWYSIKSCSSLDVKCHFDNLKKAFKSILHTRGFISYGAKQLATIFQSVSDSSRITGEALMKNLKELPKEAQKWFTDIQKSYSKALENYIKDVQKEIIKTVEVMRLNINTAFKDADKQFKDLLSKYSKEVDKELKKFRDQVEDAKKDLEAQIKTLQDRINNSTNDLTKAMKDINKQIKEAQNKIDAITKDITASKEWQKKADERFRALEARKTIEFPPEWEF